MQFNVCFFRFPYGASDHPDVTDWLVETVHAAKCDARIANVHSAKINDTPITMTRNKAVEIARSVNADYLCMVDSDMKPDCEPGAPKFWDTSLAFMLARRDEPSIVMAPYTGPPPHSNVFMFRWENWMNDNPNPDIRLEQYGRADVAQRAGFELVGAGPTGLILIDMRVFNIMKPPYFYYEFAKDGMRCDSCHYREPGVQTEKDTTEDVAFTRDATFAGIKCYANWDCWAGHYKLMCMTKPKPITSDMVRRQFSEAVLRNQKQGEKLIHVGEGLPHPRVIKTPTVLPASEIQASVKSNGHWELTG